MMTATTIINGSNNNNDHNNDLVQCFHINTEFWQSYSWDYIMQTWNPKFGRQI